MSTPEDRPVNRKAADQIIQRALQLDAERADALTEAQIRDIAAELSVSTARSTPEKVRAAWVAAVAARDADALRPLLADDYEVWAHGAPPLTGVEAAVNAMRGAIGRYHIVQSFEPIESVIAGDWAFERGIERMTVTPVDGGPSQTLAQRALLILRRGADGQWQYARGMTNGLPAAPA